GAEQRTLHGLHLAAAVAGAAGTGRGARRAAVPGTGLAEHRSLHGDVLADPEGHLVQAQVQPQQRVGALPDPAARAAGAAAAEDRLEDVAEAAEAGERAALPTTRGERVAAQVDYPPLLRVRQHL